MLDIRIAKPCSQTWTAMKGDEQVRHCGACRKNVYNIAQMTEKEVEDLIRRTEGKFCARIYRRTDGRILTADCPRGVAVVRRKRTLAVGAAMTAAVGILWPALRPARMGAVARPHRLTRTSLNAPMDQGSNLHVNVTMGFISGRSTPSPEADVPSSHAGYPDEGWVIDWSTTGFRKSH